MWDLSKVGGTGHGSRCRVGLGHGAAELALLYRSWGSCRRANDAAVASKPGSQDWPCTEHEHLLSDLRSCLFPVWMNAWWLRGEMPPGTLSSDAGVLLATRANHRVRLMQCRWFVQ